MLCVRPEHETAAFIAMIHHRAEYALFKPLLYFSCRNLTGNRMHSKDRADGFRNIDELSKMDPVQFFLFFLEDQLWGFFAFWDV